MKNSKVENIYTLKEKFASLVRFYIKRNHVAQADLARIFNLTPSAICQMINCNILFELEQVSIIGKVLKLSDDELFELQSIIYKIRNGASLHSPFNKLVKKLRKGKKYSIADLSCLSQIPRKRLTEFEENFETDITQEELETLSQIFEYKLRDLCNLASMCGHEIIDNDDEEEDDSLNENSSFELTRKVPLIEIDELSIYNNNLDLQAIVNSKIFRYYEHATEKEVIALEASNSLLSIPFPGRTILIAREYNELDPTAKVFVGMDKKECCYLFNRDDFGNFNYFFSGQYFTKAPKLKWRLTIEEIIISTEE